MNHAAAFPPNGAYELATPACVGELDCQKRDGILWMTAAFWGLHAMALWIADALEGHPNLLFVGAMRFALTLVGLALCYGIHVILQRLDARPWRRKAPVVLLASLVAAELFAWCSYLGLSYARGVPVHPAIEGATVIRTLVPWTWFFLAWVGLYLAVQYGFEARAEERRSSQLRLMTQSAKLQALHYQINPHFLFNSFNSVSALILDGRSDDANAMVERLAAFFRANLATDPEVDISLVEEIALQANYLEIERVRYPDLEFRIDLPKALERAAIPAFLLQPLIENAIKHGSSGPGATAASIAIAAREEGKLLRVAVANSCPGEFEDRCIRGTGTGIRNVRNRLSGRFQAGAKLTTERFDGSGFRVLLEMPLSFVT